MKEDLFKSILQSLVIRNYIFKCIKEINRNNNQSKRSPQRSPLFYNYDQLVIEPIQLILYDYIDTFFGKLDQLIIAFQNNNSNSSINELYPKYKSALLFLFVRSCENSDLNTLRVICSHSSYYELIDFGTLDIVFLESCINNRINVVQLLSERFSDDLFKIIANKSIEIQSSNLIDTLSSFGHLELIKYLDTNQLFRDRVGFLTTNAIDQAARNGHFGVIKYLLENNNSNISIVDLISDNAIDYSSSKGYIEIVRYLDCYLKAHADHSNKNNNISNNDIIKVGCTKKAIDLAAYNGYLEVVRYLSENRTEGCSCDAIDMAAGRGHFEIVRYLSENRTEGCTVKAMDLAAENGHIHIVEWLQSNRTEGCTSRAIDSACLKGYIDIVDYLLENNRRGSDKAIEFACYEGNLELVQLLNRYSVPFTTSSILRSTLKLFNYIIQLYKDNLLVYKDNNDNNNRKFPIKETIEFAAKNGNNEMINTLCELFPDELNIIHSEAMNLAAGNGHLKTIIHLERLGIVRGCTTAAMDISLYRGHLDCIEYLHRNRTEGCTERALNYALHWQDNNQNVIDYLLSNHVVSVNPNAW